MTQVDAVELEFQGITRVEDLLNDLPPGNVFDEDPPLAPQGSGNSMPDAYDALGRYWFTGISVRL